MVQQFYQILEAKQGLYTTKEGSEEESNGELALPLFCLDSPLLRSLSTGCNLMVPIQMSETNCSLELFRILTRDKNAAPDLSNTTN